ncbi:MAG: hypothetical protein CME70_05805 [Halobacteriovorax sp.]|nr:hypothetical protein [Halobacteriovorax sp.]|tara:strand:- start:2280 stop:2522 length:243 start_codon:yes stop_codon:yes gene_type:complete
MVTLNKDGTPRKRGSGKTKGKTCYTNVTLATLKEIVKDSVTIPVSRKWLEALGVDISKPVEDEQKEESPQKVEFNITDFE